MTWRICPNVVPCGWQLTLMLMLILMLSKPDLLALCDRLLWDEAAAVEQCVTFIEAETLRLWHGRARAKMARRLKLRSLDSAQRDRLVRSILASSPAEHVRRYAAWLLRHERAE